MSPEHPIPHKKSSFTALAIGAIGVVYGDVGTSPLYTMKEVFNEAHGLALNQANVYGAVSLIFWALMLVVCLKYVVFIMRADNRGEGGIMALMALALRNRRRQGQRTVIIALGLLGAALFYGDSMITPAISVLSAVEGLQVAAPSLHRYVIPLSVLVLVGLFMIQSKGTEKVGKLFGPVMIVWFITLALLGLRSIGQHPDILWALHPKYGVAFFVLHGWQAFLALGAVVLAVTGTEALYADMGHFGRRPIQVGWWVFVMPALVLNYLGQAALIMVNPETVSNPFYRMAPEWALYPMIGLSTAATIIASQAVISGAFSITRQAVQLDYLPRQNFIHTSGAEIGQIYAPAINHFLLVSVLILVLVFQDSGNLASAYGFAVTGTMAITTSLAFIVALDVWKWPPKLALVFLVGFLAVDLPFLGANAVKIPDGGWFPLLIGTLLYLLMNTWKKGRQALVWHLQHSAISLTQFLSRNEENPARRVPGTAIFLYGRHLSLPSALLQNVEYNTVLHERVILLTVATQDIPVVPKENRLEIEDLGQNVYRVTVNFGFTQSPDVPGALRLCKDHGLELNLREAKYFIGHETLIPSDNPALSPWQEKLFIYMFRNASNPVLFFQIPTDQALLIGTLVDI